MLQDFYTFGSLLESQFGITLGIREWLTIGALKLSTILATASLPSKSLTFIEIKVMEINVYFFKYFISKYLTFLFDIYLYNFSNIA
jgi:hypothetical protein